MRGFCIAVVILASLGLVAHCICLGVTSWHINQAIADLKLADDASSPAKKSEYMGKFITKMEKSDVPKYNAFIFTNERDSVPEQIQVLKSLKTRCDDLINVDPNNFAYATGMGQITGQEFKHVMENIEIVFKGAMWVQAGWFLVYGWAIELLIIIIGALGWVISPESNNGRRYH